MATDPRDRRRRASDGVSRKNPKPTRGPDLCLYCRKPYKVENRDGAFVKVDADGTPHKCKNAPETKSAGGAREGERVAVEPAHSIDPAGCPGHQEESEDRGESTHAERDTA